MATAGGQVPVRLNHVGAAAAAIAALVMVPLLWSIPLAALAGGASFRLLPTGFTRDGDGRRWPWPRPCPMLWTSWWRSCELGFRTQATMVVAVATNEPLVSHLSLVARHRRLGAGPGQAWRQVAHVPQLGDLAAAMARHADTGSPIAPVLDRVAADALTALLLPSAASRSGCRSQGRDRRPHASCRIPDTGCCADRGLPAVRPVVQQLCHLSPHARCTRLSPSAEPIRCGASRCPGWSHQRKPNRGRKETTMSKLLTKVVSQEEGLDGRIRGGDGCGRRPWWCAVELLTSDWALDLLKKVIEWAFSFLFN